MLIKKKKWLVLGAHGQLGREWYHFLKNAGMEFRALNRKEADISDSALMESVLREYSPDFLINCAAFTRVDEAEVLRSSCARINAEASGYLARLCCKLGIRMVHYSTDYVFPGLLQHRSRFPDGYPVTFDPDPVNWYGQTKWMGEQQIMESGAEYIIVRVSWLCGRFGRNFVTVMLELAKKGKQIRVVNDQWGCPAFAEPLVKNTCVLLEQGCKGTFHFSSSGETNWLQFCEAIFKQAGISIEVEGITSKEWISKARRPEWSRLELKELADVPGTCILPWQVDLNHLLQSL